MPVAKQKDMTIETLRGLAIILMVAGHVIGDKPTNGLRVADDSEFRHFYYSLQFFRLPLFTVISGWVYTLRPVIAGKSLSFLRGKGRRILFPMAAVGTLEFLMRAVVPGTNTQVVLSEIWRIYLFPFDHFWFLQAIFLVFVTVTLLERFELLKTPGRWALALALMTFLEWSPSVVGDWTPSSNPFSFQSYLYLLPFFVLGLGIGRFPQTLRSPWLIGPAAVIFALGIVYQQATWYGVDLPGIERLNTRGRGSLFGMAIGLTGCTLLFRVRWTTAWLAWLGYYAYGIYLFHVFGTAGSRIVATKLLGLETGLPLFFLSLGFGLGVPVLIEWIVERPASSPQPVLRKASNALRLAFFGLRPRKPPQPDAAQTQAEGRG